MALLILILIMFLISFSQYKLYWVIRRIDKERNLPTIFITLVFIFLHITVFPMIYISIWDMLFLQPKNGGSPIGIAFIFWIVGPLMSILTQLVYYVRKD